MTQSRFFEREILLSFEMLGDEKIETREIRGSLDEIEFSSF